MNLVSAHTGNDLVNHGFELADGIIGVVLIILVIVVVYYFKKRKKKGQKSGQGVKNE